MVYKEIEVFGYNVCEKKSDMIESMKNVKFGQNMSNKQKTALKNFLKNKNTSIAIQINRRRG